MTVEQLLTQPQWIAQRNDNNLRPYPFLQFESLQTLAQLPGRERSRQFIGMQAGLHIYFAHALHRPVTKRRNGRFGTGNATSQRNLAFFHFSSMALAIPLSNLWMTAAITAK